MNLALETAGALPLYREVKRLLTLRIAAHEWPPGTPLPSEGKLGGMFQVSIGTIRKAIDELVAERIVVRQQGRGTFVATHNPSRLLFHFFHIVPRKGERQLPRTRMLSFRRARASAEEAQKLQIASGEPVYRIRNLLLLADRPVILDDLVLPQRLFPDLTEKIFTGRDNTIYHLYQTRYGVNVLRTSERLRATIAESDAAKLLGLKKGAPLLEINRVALTYHNAPVELRRSLVDTSAHEYFSDLGKAER
ncbi:MAG: GntR family transcriptional regulator [Betaproteobacteria bacterium]|nr:MAG: GntR family transcriptional regulator [Betaproteobacteria bacterium]